MELIRISILLSFLATVVIGLVAGKKIKNKSENYAVAGRSWPALFVAIALVSQAIDGNTTLGNTQLSSDFGFWAGAALPIGLSLSLFILGFFFAGRLNNLKLITIADLFERKYNAKIAFLASIILLFGFGILLAGNIAAIGILVKIFFPIKYETAVIFIVLVTLLYTFRGGIISDLYTDIFQMLLVVMGICLTFIFLWLNHGPVDFSLPAMAGKFSLAGLTDLSGGALINWATIASLAFGNLIAIDFAARIFSARTADNAKRGCYAAGWLTLLLGLPFSFLIFYITKINLPLDPGTPAIITLALSALPAFISALLIVSIISAALSTIDGAILSMGNILSRNILNIKAEESTEGVEETEKSIIYFYKIALFPITFAAMIFAFLLPSPGALISVAFDITFASILIPFVFAFSEKWSDPRAAFYSIIAGGLSRIIFALLTPTLFGLPNPFYLENAFISPALDGLGTFISPLLALAVYTGFIFFSSQKLSLKKEMAKI